VGLTAHLGYYARTYGVVKPGGVTVTPPTLTLMNPTSAKVGGPQTFALSGTRFAAGMLARFWDGAGTFRGTSPCVVSSATAATTAPNLTGWTVGTGGVDVYINGNPSPQQLQFAITP
jgi:hypothetical protein